MLRQRAKNGPAICSTTKTQDPRAFARQDGGGSSSIVVTVLCHALTSLRCWFHYGIRVKGGFELAERVEEERESIGI